MLEQPSSSPTSKAVQTFELVRQFGDFVAVDHINLEVERGSFRFDAERPLRAESAGVEVVAERVGVCARRIRRWRVGTGLDAGARLVR